MSLEDKAKEQIGKLDPAAYLACHRIESYKKGYREALKDMMERCIGRIERRYEGGGHSVLVESDIHDIAEDLGK